MASGGAENKANIKLKWREGKKAPYTISKRCIGEAAATVDGNSVYNILSSAKVYSYSASGQS